MEIFYSTNSSKGNIVMAFTYRESRLATSAVTVATILSKTKKGELTKSTIPSQFRESLISTVTFPATIKFTSTGGGVKAKLMMVF